jgi:hypothetical protein
MSYLYELSEKEFGDQIRRYCVEHPKLVRALPVLGGSALILKYKKDVFYNNLWTPEILECRGTIVDAKTFVPIQRPFTKIFSESEGFAPKFDKTEEVFAFEKINGYMISATIHDGELLLSSTGTIDSDFVKFARSKFAFAFAAAIRVGLINDAFTTIFEVVDSGFDPHIISDQNGLWALASRSKKWLSKSYFHYEGDVHEQIHYPEMFISTFGEIQEKNESWEREGFIVQSTVSPKELKMKSPFYTAVKFLARKNAKATSDLFLSFDVKGRINTPRWFSRKTNELIHKGLSQMITQREWILSLDEQQKVGFLRHALSQNVS